MDIDIRKNGMYFFGQITNVKIHPTANRNAEAFRSDEFGFPLKLLVPLPYKFIILYYSILCGILFIIVSRADINCYTCMTDDSCKDPFNKNSVKTEKCEACLKTKVLKGTGEGKSLIEG